MLTVISVFTCITFSSFYLLGFWIVRGHSIAASFRKFNLTAANLIAGLGLVVLVLMNIPLSIKIFACVWKISIFSVSRYSWKTEKVNVWLLTIPSVLGVILMCMFLGQFLNVGWGAVSVVALGCTVLCLSLFTMILGHWYLNVPGLPIKYLMRASNIFWGVVTARALVDIILLVTQKMLYHGDYIWLYQFVGRAEGFLLFVPLFFATLLPIVLLYFVKGTLDVKSTQSATGILYVIVIGVLMGDLAYKYYLFKYGIAL